MKVEDQQLKLFLVDSGAIKKKDLEKAEAIAEKKKERLEKVLISKKLIKEDELIKLKAYILGIPFVDLEKENIPKELLQVIPEPIAKKHNIIVFKKTGDELQVAMLDPEDLQTIDFIKKTTNLKIIPCLTTRESIKNAVKLYQKSLEAEFGEIIKKEAPQISIIKEMTDKEGKKGVEKGEEEDLKKVAEEMPVIKIVDTLLKHAILQKASDIHVEPMEKEIVVRYRIDGLLHEAMVLPKRIADGVIARIKVLSNLKLDEHRLPQDGRFKVETKDYKYSLRVSILPVFDGEKIVIRLLEEKTKALTLEDLGFRSEALEMVYRSIKKPNGMILVTGPTGSGKTTTLYSILHLLNKPEVNISTVEDPIEYRMQRVNQTQVKPKIGLTFSSGLRSLLRQDPDVIMVGEIRDKETAEIALHAALTGHLVLSTLHTNSAAGTLPRLLDMEIEPYLIASTVNIIVAQRLVRKICQECKTKYKLTKEAISELSKHFNLDSLLEIMKREKTIGPKDTFEAIPFYKGKGCETCHKEGYKGRLGIYEVLEVSEGLGKLLVKNPTADELNELARKEQKMIFMHEDGFMKAVHGLTTIDEIVRTTKE